MTNEELNREYEALKKRLDDVLCQTTYYGGCTLSECLRLRWKRFWKRPTPALERSYAQDAMTAFGYSWKQIAEQNQRNADYYKSIVVEIGEMFGLEAKTSKTGDVLCAKVSDLVRAKLADLNARKGEQ